MKSWKTDVYLNGLCSISACVRFREVLEYVREERKRNSEMLPGVPLETWLIKKTFEDTKKVFPEGSIKKITIEEL